MNGMTPSSKEGPESAWAWVSKPWPWWEISVCLLGYGAGLVGLIEKRAFQRFPELDPTLKTAACLLLLSGLASGVFAWFWSRHLERTGRKMPTYEWRKYLLGGFVLYMVIRSMSDQSKPPQPVAASVPPVVEVAAPEVKTAPTLRTSDGQFEIDVPASWTKLPSTDPRAYGGAMTDPSGTIGVGLYSEPRERSLAMDAVAFGEQHLKTFSSKFDEVTVLEATASFRPGRPPLRQIVEARSGQERMRFVLIYGQSSKAFYQLRVWGPAAEFQVHEPLLREIAGSLREVP